MHADSNRAVCCSSNSCTVTMSPPQGSDRIAERQREVGHASVVVLGELDPGADLRGVRGQRRTSPAAAGRRIVVAARHPAAGSADSPPTRAAYIMWNSVSITPTNVASTWRWSTLDVEREVIVALDDPEAEAIPLQRIRRARRRGRAPAPASARRAGRHELDVGGVGNSMADDFGPSSVVLEPAAIRVVPTKMRVDDVGHRADVALARRHHS